jgi:hypothetical protein
MISHKEAQKAQKISLFSSLCFLCLFVANHSVPFVAKDGE